MLTFIIGGARSGKSRFAQSLGAGARHAVYLATSRCEDAEMAARIARHRASRPAGWVTIEEPVEIARAVEEHAARADFLLLDCLTVWLGNLMWRDRDLTPAAMETAARGEIARLAAAAAQGRVVVVSNEVGCGIVPEGPVARLFRDLQGWVNQDAAAAADRVYHMVAGIAVPIKQPGEQVERSPEEFSR